MKQLPWKQNKPWSAPNDTFHPIMLTYLSVTDPTSPRITHKITYTVITEKALGLGLVHPLHVSEDLSSGLLNVLPYYRLDSHRSYFFLSPEILILWSAGLFKLWNICNLSRGFKKKKNKNNLYAGRIYLKVNLQGSGCQFLSRNTSNKVSHMERKKANYQQTNKQTKTLSGWNRRIQSHFGIWKQESHSPIPSLCISSQHKFWTVFFKMEVSVPNPQKWIHSTYWSKWNYLVIYFFLIWKNLTYIKSAFPSKWSRFEQLTRHLTLSLL